MIFLCEILRFQYPKPPHWTQQCRRWCQFWVRKRSGWRCGQSLRDTAHCRCIWKEMLRRNDNWLVWLGIVSYQDDIQNPDVCSRFFYQSLAQCLVFKVLFCAMWLIAWLIARPCFFSLLVSLPLANVLCTVAYLPFFTCTVCRPGFCFRLPPWRFRSHQTVFSFWWWASWEQSKIDHVSHVCWS